MTRNPWNLTVQVLDLHRGHGIFAVSDHWTFDQYQGGTMVGAYLQSG
jgi:hypothetical protein